MSIKHTVMPNLGESVTEATVVTWLVEPGDTVNKYDGLLEAQSDKVVTEIPSEFDGTVKEILVEADATVSIGTPLLTMEVEEAAEVDESAVEIIEETETPKEMIQEAFESGPEEETQEEAGDEAEDNQKNRKRYSPAVLRISQEKGIDLEDVPGTGRHGRITRKDVENFDPKMVKKEAASVSAPTISAADGDTAAREVVAADSIRKTIANNVMRSVTEIPHAWMMVEADVTNLVKLRKQFKDRFMENEGISLSYFPFFVKAVAQALKKHPLLNASWNDGKIIYNKDIHISIAVATDDHLYVPVIKHADQYSVKGIAKEINRLAEGARTGKLKPEDVQGGTFTVNNTGALGSVQSMGIINYPQAAILQVERIQERFVPANGGFKVAHMVNLCLSIDHRLLDGLQAGRFLQEVKENLSLYEKEAHIY